MASHPDYAHLPEGREPGWQTQNASREARRQVGVWMMFLLGVAMIGVGIYFMVEPAKPSRPQPDILALAFFGGIGLGVIVWGEILRRRGMPKPPPFSIEVEDTKLRRGESSRARIECLDPAKVKRPLTVGVVCREFYTVVLRQHVGTQSNTTVPVEEAREVEVAGTTQTFDHGDCPVTVEFTVPADAPYSYEGTKISLAWGVIVEEENRLRRKRAIGPFWVAP
jgi:hypothetical protein